MEKLKAWPPVLLRKWLLTCVIGIGCLLVGIVESFSTMAFSGYKDVTVFLLLIIFLVFRPTGLFKGKIGDKA